MAKQQTKRAKWNDTSGERGEKFRVSDAYAFELDKMAVEQARRREPLTTRWYHDTEQYQGVYSETIRRELAKSKAASKLFVNLTRPKVRVLAARLNDILFPTDDLNWSMEATPVPELEALAKRGKDAAIARPPANPDLLGGPAPAPPPAGAAPIEASGGVPAMGGMAGEGPAPAPEDPVMEAAKKTREVAREKAEMMQRECADQLKEARFNDIGQKALEQMCKLGNGVVKGPITDWRRKRKWKEAKDGGWEMEEAKDERPYFEWVDLWNWFPDMDATSIEACDFIFELHRASARELRKWAKRQDFIGDAIRDVLKQGPMYESFTDYVNDLRDIETEIIRSHETRYYVWEYHGPIPKAKMLEMAEAHEVEDIVDVYGRGGEDPLEVIDGIVWFCQGRIIKFHPHPLDSGDHMYSTVRLDSDESSIFSDGVPSMLRDPQRALNGAWRLMMQNAALAGLPMFVIDRTVQPVEGERELAPGKIWEREHANEFAGIQAVDVTGNTTELRHIIEMSMLFMDQETNLPLISQGETASGGGGDQKSAHGMALLANAVNVIFRNVARSFDRDFTIPCLRRLYDWNMQFNPKAEIKGDVTIDARGSSVLLVRDVQAQNLLMIINLAATNPTLGQLLKVPAIARRLFQALQLSKDEMVLSEAELVELQEKLANQGDPEGDLKLQVEQIKADTQIAVAEMNMKTEILRLAAAQEQSIEKIAADLEKVKIKADSDERSRAAEFAIKRDMGSGI